MQDVGRNVKLHLGRTSILVRDALRRPLLEAEIGSVQASLSQRSQHVSQVHTRTCILCLCSRGLLGFICSSWACSCTTVP